MNKALACLALSCLAILAACNRPSEPAPLEGATIGGDFVLTGEDGSRVDSKSFAGKYRLVYFGYTYCPDVCPVDMQNLMKGLKLFAQSDAARAKKVQPIFITLDPARDTPAVLKEWTAAFHPRLIGLTGTDKEIDEVARKYAIIYSRQKPNEQGAYLVDHARMATLFGPKGEPIALVPQDKDGQTVAAELDRWVR